MLDTVIKLFILYATIGAAVGVAAAIILGSTALDESDRMLAAITSLFVAFIWPLATIIGLLLGIVRISGFYHRSK